MSPPEPRTEACRSCGSAVDPTANFCPQCGAATDEQSVAVFCPECGDPFDPDDEFCSQCGHSRTAGGDATQPSSETAEAFRRRVQRHLELGWEIDSDHRDRATLVDREIGSIPIHIFLLFLSSGVGNLLYGWYHYSYLAEKRHLSVGDRKQPRPPGAGNSEASAGDADGILSSLSSYAVGGLLLFIGLLFLASSGGSLGGVTIGAGLALGGSVLLPPVKRRFDRRHAVTNFGRLRTVDHRICYQDQTDQKSCVVCGTPVSRGLVRRRRDETVIAGVPVSTHGMDHNHYCIQCATEELGIGEFDTAVDTGEMETVATANVGSDSS